MVFHVAFPEKHYAHVLCVEVRRHAAGVKSRTPQELATAKSTMPSTCANGAHASGSA